MNFIVVFFLCSFFLADLTKGVIPGEDEASQQIRIGDDLPSIQEKDYQLTAKDAKENPYSKRIVGRCKSIDPLTFLKCVEGWRYSLSRCFLYMSCAASGKTDCMRPRGCPQYNRRTTTPTP